MSWSLQSCRREKQSRIRIPFSEKELLFHRHSRLRGNDEFSHHLKHMLSIFLQKYDIASTDTLIIACSSGPDSMYLLSESMKSHDPKRLVVAHFNHALRGAESDGDETFLRDFCTEQGLVFESEKKDI